MAYVTSEWGQLKDVTHKADMLVNEEQRRCHQPSSALPKDSAPALEPWLLFEKYFFKKMTQVQGDQCGMLINWGAAATAVSWLALWVQRTGASLWALASDGLNSMTG